MSALTGLIKNFTIVDGYLTWKNEAFDGGAATFCAVNETVMTVFNGFMPPNCIPVRLLAVSASKAVNHERRVSTKRSEGNYSCSRTDNSPNGFSSHSSFFETDKSISILPIGLQTSVSANMSDSSTESLLSVDQYSSTTHAMPFSTSALSTSMSTFSRFQSSSDLSSSFRLASSY